MVHQAGEQAASIGRADRGFHVVLRVWHHAEHITAVVENARDRVGRAVDVPFRIEAAVGRGVAEQYPALALEPRDRLLVGDVVALAVRHRHPDYLPGVVAASKWRV